MFKALMIEHNVRNGKANELLNPIGHIKVFKFFPGLFNVGRRTHLGVMEKQEENCLLPSLVFNKDIHGTATMASPSSLVTLKPSF